MQSAIKRKHCTSAQGPEWLLLLAGRRALMYVKDSHLFNGKVALLSITQLLILSRLCNNWVRKEVIDSLCPNCWKSEQLPRSANMDLAWIISTANRNISVAKQRQFCNRGKHAQIPVKGTCLKCARIPEVSGNSFLGSSSLPPWKDSKFEQLNFDYWGGWGWGVGGNFTTKPNILSSQVFIFAMKTNLYLWRKTNTFYKNKKHQSQNNDNLNKCLIYFKKEWKRKLSTQFIQNPTQI